MTLQMKHHTIRTYWVLFVFNDFISSINSSKVLHQDYCEFGHTMFLKLVKAIAAFKRDVININ